MRVPGSSVSLQESNDEIRDHRESRADDHGTRQLTEAVGRLASDAARGGLLVFAGAGISVPLPSGCPTWAGFKEEIVGRFLDKLIQEDWPKKPYLIRTRPLLMDLGLRPETFMWALKQTIGLDMTIDFLRGIDRSSPNLNHEMLADLCQAGVIRAIVTTNFDTYIERALATRGVEYAIVRDAGEAGLVRDLGSAPVLIFKPHGCLSKPSSMEYSIDQIQSLPRGKRELLSGLLKSFPVLIVGYSGNDEDIFPVVCEALAQSEHRSCLCVFPGSPPSEPLQQWDVAKVPHVERLYADPLELLSSVGAILEPALAASSHHPATSFPHLESSWREHLSDRIEEIGHDVVAVAISHLCHLHGNHEIALSFANLAQDICEDTNLSSRPRETLMFAKEMKARALKELLPGTVAEQLQGGRLTESLRGHEPRELIDAQLGRAHASLRNGDLSSAERDLDHVRAYLMLQGSVEPENASAHHLAFLWYSAILKRKQGHAEQADILFNQAIAVAHAQDDIIHGARILLDYGYVKCQLSDWESAQQVWALATKLAEQANDWDTAAKAAKNRGMLLSISDNPRLGRPELQKSKLLFQRGGNYEGVKRAEEALRYSHQELLMATLAMGQPGT